MPGCPLEATHGTPEGTAKEQVSRSVHPYLDPTAPENCCHKYSFMDVYSVVQGSTGADNETVQLARSSISASARRVRRQTAHVEQVEKNFREHPSLCSSLAVT